jgi:hypothetical protein
MLRNIFQVEKNGHSTISIFERLVNNGVVEFANIFDIKSICKSFGKLSVIHSCDPQKFHFQAERVLPDLITPAYDVKRLHATAR